MLLINTFDIGGAERVYAQLARGLAHRGFRVVAACLQRRSGRLAQELACSGIEVLDLRARSRVDALVIARLARALTRERVSVLYTFLIHSHVIGRIAARAARTPVVLSSQQTMGWEGKWNERLNRLTARWCSRVIGVSRNVSEYLVEDVGIPRGKVTTIYNCVDVSRFAETLSPPHSDAGPVIGMVARLDPAKDYDSLLRAFTVIAGRYPTARLLLAGDGPERARLGALVDELGLSGAVEFLGHVSDVRTVHNRIHVYVQSSHTEGMPVAVLEALASGLPVVASRVGGNEEAIIDGIGGLLVPPADPSAMAAAIQRLIENPDEARAIGDAGRRHVRETFSVDAVVEATTRLIQQALGAGPT
jgi:glycosyltransferase involved in cell wall biosynthesis